MHTLRVKNIIAVCWVTLLLAGAAIAEDQGNSPGAGEVKLTPGMRIIPATRSVYKINTAAITPYLENFVVFPRQEDYTTLPYVLGIMGDNQFAAVGDRVYALGIKSSDLSAFTILADTGKELIDPVSKEKLGYQAQVIGNAELQQAELPQVLLVTRFKNYIPVGARLTPRIGLDLPDVLEVNIPDKYMAGTILYTQNENTGGGKFDVVVISIGQRDGVQRGDLFALIEKQTELIDDFTDKTYNSIPTVFGEVVIYKVMEKVSLGFVLEATRAVVINDKAIVLVQQPGNLSGGGQLLHGNNTDTTKTKCKYNCNPLSWLGLK